MNETGGGDKQATRRTKRAGGGRPPVSRAGEVNRRILDAATRLFLQRGFEGTSCDQVALDARAGKASIYARYANKEALFAAVIEDNLGRALAQTEDVLADKPLCDRLNAVGISIIQEALNPNAVALLRLIVAEVPRFPEMVLGADRIGWKGGVRRVAEAIAARDRAHDNPVNRAMPAAAKFIDLVLVPHLMLALLGENPDQLRATAPQRIKDALAMLTATGWFADWE